MTTTDHGSLPNGGTPGMRAAGHAGRGPVSPTGAPAGNRLPHAPRERKPALAALAVLLILGGALVSTSLVLSSGDTVSAIAMARDVQPGQQISRADLREVKVAENGGLQFVRWTPGNVTAVTKAYARVPLVKGSLLHTSQATGHSMLENGKVAVGLTLKPGQFPNDLKEGALVRAYLAGPGDAATAGSRTRVGEPLVEQAWVQRIFGSDDKKRQAGSDTLVTVVVDEQEAAVLTPAAARGDVALVLLPPSGN
jgi:hypothetical protein